MKEKLIEDLSFLGNSPSCNQILNGSYFILEEVDPYTSVYIQELKRLDNTNNKLKAVITIEVFKQGWRKIKEKKTADISGIYFEHLKACAMD